MDCKCGKSHDGEQDAELKAIMEELLNKDAEELGREARAVAVDIVKVYNAMPDEKRKLLTPEQITVVKEAIAVVSRKHAPEPAEDPESFKTTWVGDGFEGSEIINKTFKSSGYSVERTSYLTAKEVVKAYNELTEAQKNSLVVDERETVEQAIRIVAKGPPEKPEGSSIYSANLLDELRSIGKIPNKSE